MKKLLLFLLPVFLVTLSKAQYFQTGQDPASIKWRQINTANFQLIYPDYYEDKAQRLAAIMEAVYPKIGTTVHHKPKKISIILHTQTVKSNGLVAWAPKRMEFYTIPNQGIYAQEWIEQLAIHESRHVVQIDKVNSELPKIVKAILGEQGTALVFGAYLPWWFIEGDAVVTETAFSNSGRGRFPSFLVEHRALAVEKGNYKYDKAYNSSYKNYVPNHYQLGYYLVGSSRERYGPDLWNSVLNNVGSRPFSLAPFNKALKENIGLTKVQLYNSVFDSLKTAWEKEDKNYKQEKLKIISPKKKVYTNYRYNHWLNDSTIISYKTALNRIPSFVRINLKGDEQKIHQPGTIFDESVNYRDDWVVWSEQVPDLRWEHSGQSIIRLLNLTDNKVYSLNTEFTALTPSISADKTKIVVVESDFSSNFFLSVYEISTGKLTSRFKTDADNYFFSPEWLNNNEIVAVILTKSGKHFCKVNLKTSKIEILNEDDLGEIKNLKVINDEIYFVSSYTGKDALYVFNLIDKTILQIYEPRFGLESPAFYKGSDKFIVSDLTSDGLRLIELDLKNFKTKEIENISKKEYSLADKLTEQEPGIFDFSVIDSSSYQSKKYNKYAHIFNFHSWAPLSIDADNYEFSPGVSFLSQNKLGTASLNVGYEWKTDEKAGDFFAKYSFKGWYPIIDLEVNTGKRAYNNYTIIDNIQDRNGHIISSDTTQKRITWNETDLGADVRIPFNLTRGKFTRYLQPEIRYDYKLYSNSSEPDILYNGNYQSFTYRLYFQQILKRSYQDVYPNFGFVNDFMYRHSPTGDTDIGNLTLEQLYLYLPGILANHGIRIYSGVQDKNSSTGHTFSEAIRYPRGWGKANTTRAYSFAFDYKLPLFYPEWNVGGLIYLQRVKASLFTDYAKLQGNLYKNGEIVGTFNEGISSLGMELTGDSNFLRFYSPVEIGFRASYLPEKKDVYFDFLISVDFNSL